MKEAERKKQEEIENIRAKLKCSSYGGMSSKPGMRIGIKMGKK